SSSVKIKLRVTYNGVTGLGADHPKKAGNVVLPLHCGDGKGELTESTGQGLIRLTCSVMLRLRKFFMLRWRRGDITIRSARSAPAKELIWSGIEPSTTRFVSVGTLFMS